MRNTYLQLPPRQPLMQDFIPDAFPVVKRGSGDAVNQRRIPRDTVVLITAPQNVPVVKRGSSDAVNQRHIPWAQWC